MRRQQHTQIVARRRQELLVQRDCELRELVGLASLVRRSAQHLRQIESRMRAEGFDVQPATVADAEAASSGCEDDHLRWVWADKRIIRLALGQPDNEPR